jgi:hypothetical protein
LVADEIDGMKLESDDDQMDVEVEAVHHNPLPIDQVAAPQAIAQLPAPPAVENPLETFSFISSIVESIFEYAASYGVSKLKSRRTQQDLVYLKRYSGPSEFDKVTIRCIQTQMYGLYF